MAEKKPETMEIPVAQLQEILDNQKNLTIAVEQLQKDKDALEKVVSQTRLQEAKAVQEVDSRPRVHFKRLPQGTVIGWPDSKSPADREDIVNQLIINPQTNVAMGEMLKFRYHLADGSKTPLMDYSEFIRCSDLTFARVIEDHGESALVEFEDKSVSSKPLEINKKFWNA